MASAAADLHPRAGQCSAGRQIPAPATLGSPARPPPSACLSRPPPPVSAAPPTPAASVSPSLHPTGPAIFNHIVIIHYKRKQTSRTKIEIEITWSACIPKGRGWRIAAEELVLLARIWESVGVEAVSMVLLAIKYRPCFLPPPALMTTSPSMSWAVGSQSGPWTSFATS